MAKNKTTPNVQKRRTEPAAASTARRIIKATRLSVVASAVVLLTVGTAASIDARADDGRDTLYVSDGGPFGSDATVS